MRFRYRINRVVYCLLLSATVLLFFVHFCHGQDDRKFVPEREDWKPFLGQWDGKWDSVWPVRFIVSESSDGKIEMYYAYKEFVTDDDYISNELENFQLLDKETLASGRIRLWIPKVDNDGKTLLATIFGEKGLRRSVVIRTR